MGILIRIYEFLLYTNIWISASAGALYLFSRYLFTGEVSINTTALFVTLSCIWIYSLHRFIGLSKIKSYDQDDRFYKINALKTWIFGIALIAFITASVMVFRLNIKQLAVFALPGILSLLYVLPIFKDKKRLRDINYLKIFVIAFVWALLTVWLPFTESNSGVLNQVPLLLFVERFLFIFAITLPFDVRDLKVDALIKVRTIPARIGISSTKILSYLLLGLSASIILYLYYLNAFPIYILSLFLISNLITAGIIQVALRKQTDFYYTGLLDGTMYLHYILLVLGIWMQWT